MDATLRQREAEISLEKYRLTRIEADFAGQIATAVWLRRLTVEAAREALCAYALACRGAGDGAHGFVGAALEYEYRRCRERQELCS